MNTKTATSPSLSRAGTKCLMSNFPRKIVQTIILALSYFSNTLELGLCAGRLLLNCLGGRVNHCRAIWSLFLMRLPKSSRSFLAPLTEPATASDLRAPQMRAMRPSRREGAARLQRWRWFYLKDNTTFMSSYRNSEPDTRARRPRGKVPHACRGNEVVWCP